MPAIKTFTSNNPGIQTSVISDTTLTDPTVGLSKALAKGNLEQIRAVVEAQPSLVHVELEVGSFPLHLAVRLRRPDIASYFVSKGADPGRPDRQGLTALEYAANGEDIEMLRTLMSPHVVKKIDSAQSDAASYKFSSSRQVAEIQKCIQELAVIVQKLRPSVSHSNGSANSLQEAIMAGDRNSVQRLLKSGKQVDRQLLSTAMMLADDEILADLIAQYSSSFNQLSEKGISPMHEAACLHREKALQKMVAAGANLFLKNSEGVAPADLLFVRAAQKDLLALKKAQLLLCLLSVGSIIADHVAVPQMSPEAAAIWRGALLLLNVGMDVSLTYQAYLDLNPQTLWGKAFYWSSALVTFPAHAVLAKIPSVKVLWDIWRTYAVCKGAFAELGVSYRNFSYDKMRSLRHAALQLATAGTVVYQTRESIQKVARFFTQQVPEFVETYLDLSKREKAFEERQAAEWSQLEKAKNEQSAQLQEKERAFEKRKTSEMSALEKAKIELLLQQKEAQKEQRRLEDNVKAELKQAEDHRSALQTERSAWEEEAKQSEVCKIILKDDIKTYKENYLSHVQDPGFSFLIDESLDPRKKEEAACIFFGSNVDETGRLELNINNERVKERYREISLHYHNDKCPTLFGLSKLCTLAFRRATDAKKTLMKAAFSKPVYCTRKMVNWVVKSGDDSESWSWQFWK